MALAASTLGSMTASVTGFSIIQGFTSTLDTMLPGAWTSSQPQLVGLWSQRMGESLSPTHPARAHLIPSCGHGRSFARKLKFNLQNAYVIDRP